MPSARYQFTNLDPRFPEAEELIHHVTSRVAMDQALLNEEARDEFLRQLKVGAKFSGIRILAYVIMPNHFHLLLAVPVASVESLSEREFFSRVGPLLTKEALADLRAEWKTASQKERQALQQPYLDRMHSLSEMMRNLVQRLTRFINRELGRRGTLWQGRYRSSLIEQGLATRAVAAYLHVNPVRAGLVESPADYQWSSFEKARKADRALAITASIISLKKRERVPAAAVQALESALADMKVRMNDDELALAEAVSETIRHFTDGLIVGSAEFIERIFEAHRNQFHPNRETGARRPIGPLKLLKGKIQAFRGLQRGHYVRKK